MQSSQFPYLVWWAAFKVVSLLQIPASLNSHICVTFLSLDRVLQDEMRCHFQYQILKILMTSVLVILTHTSLSDTYLWEKQVAMWWAALWRGGWAESNVFLWWLACTQSLLSHEFQGMNLEMESFPGKSQGYCSLDRHLSQNLYTSNSEVLESQK